MQSTSSSTTEYNREADGNQEELNAHEPRWAPRIIYMRADVEHLASPLIPFAVFKDSPLLSFHAARDRKTRRLNDHLENAVEVVESLWNEPFAFLAEEERFFLVAWSAAPRISRRVVSLAELALGIATPGPYYKRWIASKAVSYRGEPVAWCIEIDMLSEQEEVIEIVLNEGNLRHLSPSPLYATTV